MENSPKNNLPNDRLYQFDIDVDHVKYYVEAMPFSFNEQVRYKIAVNGRPANIFAWDQEVELYRPIDDDATLLPDGLIRAVNRKLFAMVQLK